MVSYTAARTLGYNYGYDPLKIGLVTLAFGIGKYYAPYPSAPHCFPGPSSSFLIVLHLYVPGCTIGSLISGRWSDYNLAKLKEANGGVAYPEVMYCIFRNSLR
jgi:hypothetical protein